MLAAAAALLVLLAAAPASAKQIHDTARGDATLQSTTALPGLATGQAAEVVASVRLGAPNQRQVAVGVRLGCGPAGLRSTHQVWDGTNRMAGQRPTVLRVRMLYVAPRAGDYACRLRVTVATHIGVRGAGIPLGGVTLAATPLAAPAWTARAVETGHGANVFVPLGSREVRVPLLSWTPTAAGTYAVTADTYLTECHRNLLDKFCPQGWHYPRTGRAVTRTRLLVAPERPGPGCSPRSSRPQTVVIDSLVHHLRVPHRLVVPLDPACGAWTVSLLASDPAPGTTAYVVGMRNPYTTAYAVPVSAP
ncbi:hypothetical protein EV189_1558 [Motilibacter rhizosphaerae]|uniref:Ig-like domain-containing protein n=1 Tax=Motilibacter rhizosphaerae TaxID=598652 RepID=A0A4Q7NS70_9ACTN|nr:hypothetical protein EV189_1558 [Motilibacter rhizosphaerae]